MYFLCVISGPSLGAEWDVPEGDLVAGRDLQNPICIPDLHVSRRHFLLSRRGNTISIRNLSRTNGTFVNGNEVTEASLLAVGDRIMVGETLMELSARESISDSSISLGDDGNSTVAWLPESEEKAARENINLTVNARDNDILRITDAGSDLERLRKASRQLQLLQRMSNDLVSEFDPKKLMPMLLERIFEVIPADRGYVFLRESGSDKLMLQASKQRGSATPPAEVQVSYTLVMRALAEKIGILSADTLSDDRFKDQGSIILAGMKSVMCVPILHDEETLGLIHLYSTSAAQQLSEDDLRLLTMIANQAAISIRNARLREQVVSEETIRASLSSYVSPQLLERIVRQEITIESAAKQVEVSVLFADIRGFTRLSEGLTPNQVMELLNNYCNTMARIVFEHNGLIDKYIGDAIMAVFGSPEPEPRHAFRAVECAVAMQQAARMLAIQGQPVLIGVGVHTGEVVQGNVGHQRMMQFTAVGDTVNTASRLCSAAGPGQVIISEATAIHMGPPPYFISPNKPLELKGKSAPLNTFEVKVPSAAFAPERAGSTANPTSTSKQLGS